jgi:hypothetical protein
VAVVLVTSGCRGVVVVVVVAGLALICHYVCNQGRLDQALQRWEEWVRSKPLMVVCERSEKREEEREGRMMDDTRERGGIS